MDMFDFYVNKCEFLNTVQKISKSERTFMDESIDIIKKHITFSL